MTIRYDDPDLAIPWPLPVTGLSGRDAAAPALAVVEPMLDEWFGAVQPPHDEPRNEPRNEPST